jgi:cephalosporin hydroxylase
MSASRPDPYTPITALDDAEITLRSENQSRTVSLYSEEGLKLVASLWVKLSAEYRLMYEPRWLGVPIIQFPEDIVVMQELLWNVRPDFVVECGVAHGGSGIFYASLCELMGNGRVLGVDVEIRPENRESVENHPLSRRLELIEGSSIARTVVDKVKDRVRSAKSVLVVLDSNHSAKHVSEELRLYSDLVTVGSYVVVMDGAQADVWDIPRGKKEWKRDNPLVAIDSFLGAHEEFEVDPYYTRLCVTSNPRGFLRRLR